MELNVTGRIVHHPPDCGKPEESVKGNTGRLLLFGRTRTLVRRVVCHHLVALAVHVVVREVTDKHPSFRLKGSCHELNIFFEGSKNQTSTF